MASRIAGITIEIGGDTSDLQKSLKGIDKQLAATQSTLKDVNKLLKMDPGNVTLLTQKQKELESAISGTKNRLEELKSAQAGVEKGSKEWDALQREIIDTESNLKALEQEYKTFGSVSAQEIAAAGKKMEGFGSTVENAGKKLQPISTAAAGALAGLGGLAYKAVTTADDLNTLAKQTGLSTEEIQKMKYAADLVDVSFEDIEGALKKLKPKITEDNEALAALGVTTKNADGTTRDATDVFYDTIEALSKIENETERDQKAMEIFGKSADSLAGIIDDGGASLKAYGQEAENLGYIMGQDTLDNLNTINDTLDSLKAQAGGALAALGASVAKSLAPALDKVSGIISKVAQAISKLTPEQSEMILKILAIVAAIAPLLKVGGKLIKGIGTALTFAPKIASAVKVVGAALSPTTLLIAGIVAAVVALGVVIYKNWDKIKEWTKQMVENVKGFFENLKTSLTTIVNNIKDKVTGVWTNIKDATSKAWSSVKDATSTVWGNVKSTVSGAVAGVVTATSNSLSKVKKSFEDNGGGIKGAVSATWTGIKEAYRLGFSAVDTLTGGKLTALKTSFTETFNNVKTTVSNAWNSIKTTASTLIDGIKTTVSGKFNTIVESIKNIFKFDFKLPTLKLPTWEEIKGALNGVITNVKSLFSFDFKLPTLKLPSWDAIKGTLDGIVRNVKSKFDFSFSLPTLKLPSWDTIKGTLDGLVEKIKGVFNFTWKLPTFSLPHLKITGGEAPYGLFGKGSLPKITVSWYRKAYTDPIMFTQPTVLQTPQGLKGFGDGNGAEIVLGLNKLRELVGSAGGVTINVYAAPGQNVDDLAEAVERRLVALRKQEVAAYA